LGAHGEDAILALHEKFLELFEVRNVNYRNITLYVHQEKMKEGRKGTRGERREIDTLGIGGRLQE